jgi:outer membrane protein assembly factor BamB
MARATIPGLLIILLFSGFAYSRDDKDDLWEAARKGDATRVKELLSKGVDVNAKTKYGATALHFAADKGHFEVVRALLDHKANVNAKDTFYNATPLTWAGYHDHWKVIQALLEAGAEGGATYLADAVKQGQADAVRVILAKNKVPQSKLDTALAAVPAKHPEIAVLLKKAGAQIASKSGKTTPGSLKLTAEQLKPYAGEFESDGFAVSTVVKEGKLSIEYGGRSIVMLVPTAANTFKNAEDDNTTVTFQRQGDRVTGMVFKTGSNTQTYKRTEPKKAEAAVPEVVREETPVIVKSPQNWPSFRGMHASGVADGQYPPSAWDIAKGTNVLWKTPIPGLGNSCPVVWDDHIYVTTAIGGDPKAGIRTGLYGDVDSVNDTTMHRWCVYCLDKRSGKILWERTACEGVPKVKRHMKSTHANPTPATDGKHVVACFGSEGLYCYDRDGHLLWRCALGLLDSGWFYDPAYQWGFGSSPILFQNEVIVQCDVGRDSFLAAYDLDSGKVLWMTARDEIPSWGTPTIWDCGDHVELVANATKFIRGYDPRSGAELWRLSRNAEITVPTPIIGHGLIFVTSGYRPIQPIYGIRPGGHGDISLKDKQESNAHIAWSKSKGGPYMPTPIVYGDYLYTCSNDGTVTCYEAKTGKQVYRERLHGKGGYTASPVAADGKLYFASEEGDIAVVEAGPKYKRLARNSMADVCMATPAIADGAIFFRTQHSLVAIGRSARLSSKETRPSVRSQE